MRREYIIMSYGSDENYMLGRFVCLPVDAKSRDEITRISFNTGADVKLYFDGELLDYILEIDDADILPPYEDPTIDSTQPSALGWFDTNN